ncbi:Imm10 family immunity protein [Montanilutibacter psychrotolerans]|uniref:Immunity protein 10 n=1 Tax=Montanilutibacter psychrotolerans TaxID=1327343 RepID=A0A3M8T3W6_9GAMM|nr:Imm10 family immunity protein [Lysobacter psychrotolerans]RNF85412.1 hypothetical protein EER27_06550 [Lysobacter psychrotolerans]
MSSFAFDAKCVAVEDPDGECYLVGFADQEFDTQHYLMLQRAFEHDEQDVELGMDTFHVEWCSQENSGYGGITRFLLKPDGAEVTFDAEASEALGGMERLSISFQLGPAEHLALQEALSHVFEGSGCLELADV